MQVEMQIEGLMDAMHAAILTADYDALGQLTPELEAALSSLPPQHLTEKMLRRLQRKAERNAISAGAAAKGVRAAIQRLKDVKQIASGLVTYDENGQRAAPSGQRALSRRL
ncbi:hypothetical protein [Cypionkella sp.]|uniref:hypothetical protein n=1 Tax=Cypionkella sp. TaxID=2811411 RepID=UPI002ABC7E7A|nr:hypothetical protein [Cypionkella sp.]MDZ4276672.1 hypothetical protein [Erythrobacter sp.]MDZ4392225.1 hypothetical protein [Cypionkella sp.]